MWKLRGLLSVSTVLVEVLFAQSAGHKLDLNTESRDIPLLKLAGQVTLDEGGLREERWLVFGCSFARGVRRLLTLPVPPSPTRTSLKVGMLACGAAIFYIVIVRKLFGVSGIVQVCVVDGEKCLYGVCLGEVVRCDCEGS